MGGITWLQCGGAKLGDERGELGREWEMGIGDGHSGRERGDFEDGREIGEKGEEYGEAESDGEGVVAGGGEGVSQSFGESICNKDIIRIMVKKFRSTLIKSKYAFCTT
jgi:hypothetical protein